MSQRAISFALWSLLSLLAITCLSACALIKNSSIQPTTITNATSAPTTTFTQTIPSQPTKTPNQVPSFTPTISSTPTPAIIEPDDCLKPPENFDLVIINGMYINQRTFSMLEHAQSIYGGEIELTGYHLTQGSYTNLVSASFGTHNGGGAVDLSVIQYGTYQVLYPDIDPLIQALRIAGFAAWLRDFDQLYPGSPIHIHAIAIGDRDLSSPARDQLTGEFGYFRGFNGIPQENRSVPIPDEHDGPILCQWMLEMGYSDLRNSSP
ncbi:MAG: hypothetical protein CVU41_05150 [Chloroflexi bacterium HGW-Chloroflexi-3]|nr:MAG: hypothetical protein CVU41_05150 [Chloroflexi bacterium HGW-Chloroflexi-3]